MFSAINSAIKNLIFGEHGSNGGASSKSKAKSRLHFVLVQDRTGLSPDEMSKFKRELIAVIDKYFVIDERAFDLDYKRENDSTTLLINSPVVVRRQDGIGHDVGARKNKNGKHDKKHSSSNTAPAL